MTFTISSVKSPWYIYVEGENPDNLEWMDIAKMNREWRAQQKEDRIGVAQRLLRGAVESCEDYMCDHNWGWVHWWGNPKMLAPCKVTRVRGKWYKRKSCAHIHIDEEGSVTADGAIQSGFSSQL